ncbi:hypothetical protein HNQ59_000666 [Chitinivorax tropicus]|uniref:Uncharacterized protein TP-0789 domain-containing protein n=1 Tax=Chitinivorax tropicus TaxID=714531 RepID=A0A840ML16_9PROT|nr:outer membrane lipoprotein-sorting protein [Chitinivorax tropicus]MBB5017402.1 hypothetical protein [Chitinivorax tropicus]
MFKITVLTGLLTLASHAFASPSPQDIVRQADQAKSYAESGMEGQISMTSTSEGEQKTRELAIKISTPGTLVEFTAPSKVSGHKVLQRGRNMWYIRPGVKKPIPISPRQRLFGEAANGDIASTRYADDYTPSLLREDTLNGEPCYVFDLRANDKAVTYDRIVYWVAKQRPLGMQAEFYALTGKLLKTATFEYGNKLLVAGKAQPFISKMVITDAVNTQSQTEMRYSQFSQKAVDAALFNPDLYTE